MTTSAPIHVVAGVLRDAMGRVLVAQRQPGKHLAGYWEFPGGKIDAGETPIEALRRELAEEIGIDVRAAQPLISVPWSYPEKRIVLDAWTIDVYAGVAHAREAQGLRWIAIGDLASLPMPPADAPITTALRLPDRYLITPVLAASERSMLLEGIQRACRAGIRLIQLRQPDWPRNAIADAARAAQEICAQHGADLLLNSDVETAAREGLAGVHLPARVAARMDGRPLPQNRWVGVSCHDAAELAHAQRIGADFVTLAPVAQTPSHPDATPLGWPRFAGLTRDVALPVYALGGLPADTVPIARTHGAQGIAGIRAFWR